MTSDVQLIWFSCIDEQHQLADNLGGNGNNGSEELDVNHSGNEQTTVSSADGE